LLVAIPDQRGEFVLAQVLPDVFHRVEFWAVRRQRQEADVAGHEQVLAWPVPAGTVANQNRMCAFADLRADLLQMEVHHLRVGCRGNDGCPHSTGRTDRTEDVGRVMAIIADHARAGAGGGPYIGMTAFLADPGFVLKPDFQRLALCYAGDRLANKGREVF